MAELVFVGAGLGDERGVSLRGLAELESAREILTEGYTASLAPGSIDRLAARLGRPIDTLDRAAVEDGAAVLAALDRGGPVAFLVPGDPFTATTHVALRTRCERAGHTWRYVPGASILTAAPAVLGLQAYRFGPPVSLPAPAPGFAPTSPVEKIAANRARGLHSLVLLDLAPPTVYLTGPAAVALLLERDPVGRALTASTEVGIVARVGSDDVAAWWGAAGELRAIDAGPPLHVVIVPAAELHFEEAAAVDRWRTPRRASG